MTALTGQWGQPGSQPGLAQLGGPAYMQKFDRLLPASAKPLIAHAFQNDGVTPLASFSPLNRPAITATTANGGFNQILLSVEKPVAALAQGNIVRLSEQGGDGSYIYSGIVEDLPDSLRIGAAEHQILLSPPGYELDDTDTLLVYTSPVDVAQMVRDAVSVTAHLHCDQTSCPAWTNILAATSGKLDFRNQPVKQVLETARSIAGPTWFWYVDELFRVWFQAMGSGAVYTVPRSQYEERTKAASIQNRKNRVPALGGVANNSSAYIYVEANDLVSQGLIGIRALSPPLSMPNVTDGNALQSMANNILTVLNRVWSRVSLKVNPSYGRRIHGSWPGGAMVRYWEPAANPLQEGVQGSGGYTGNYICQSVTNDGLNQKVVAGDIPVTSQTDIQNMTNALWARYVANAKQVTPAALNLSQQVMTGTLVSGTATAGTGAASVPASQWSLGPNQFQTFDANGTTRVQMGNLPANGASAAQFGIRVNDASGNPISDSLGLIGVMQRLGASDMSPANQNFSTANGNTYTDLGCNVAITLPRSENLLVVWWLNATITAGTFFSYVSAFAYSGSTNLGSVDGGLLFDSRNGGYVNATIAAFTGLATGSYTIKMRVSTDAGVTLAVRNVHCDVYQLGA